MNLRFLFCALFATLLGALSASAQIEAGKSIQITISGVPEQDRSAINNTYPVSESGTINMPYLGQVHAAGMRTEELQSSLQSRYKSAGIYTNPTIQVIDTVARAAVNKEVVTVGGQVKGTGQVPYSKELTLWGAIQAAGGPTEFGSMKRVILTRDGQSRTYDVTKPQFMQIPLQRNDTINIPHKNMLGN